MNFFIQNETDKYKLSSNTEISQIARLAADSAKLSRDFCSLNITFTDDAGIEPVNVKFLNHEGPTDVISFDYLDDYDDDLADPDDPMFWVIYLFHLRLLSVKLKSLLPTSMMKPSSI